MEHPFMGQIILVAFDFAPRYWERCEGQLLPIADNSALYSLIGTNFGGDGKTTFALPDLRGKEPIPNTHYCIALGGAYPPRT